MDFYCPQTKFGGKVIFSQTCVKNSVHGGGGCLVHGGGGCLLRGGGLHPGGGAWWIPPPMATAAGGTHPTGMHFC